MTAPETEPVDENLWLEDIYGSAALEWATAQTDAASSALSSPDADALTGRVLEVLDADDRIPVVAKHAEFYYNFWRDRAHPRGLWRRTTLESYRSDDVEWDVLLDVDALGVAESTEWVFGGARLLAHDNTVALVSLSPDGGDAVTVREFSLLTRSFVTDGFVIPTAKSRVSWIDRDSLFVATDFGEGSMTTSSYPRTVRRLERGQSLDESTFVHEVGVDDLSVSAYRDHTPGFERDIVTESVDFYRSRSFLLVDGALTRIETPDDADLDVHREWLLVQPRSEWSVADDAYPTGSLLAIRLDDFIAGSRAFTVIFRPEAHTALEEWTWTKSSLMLTVLEDVQSRLVALDPSAGWAPVALPAVPALSTARVIDTDPDESDEFWVHVTGFTTPSSVLRGTIGDASLELVKSSPSFFDESRFEVEQHFATSDDGTRVPYFQVAERGIRLDGSHRTLLSGYGGFQHSRMPEYSGVVGRAWLERGGVYVIANIRGGGEYGPSWHTSALKQNRHRAYEDFASVARDLVARGVTVPAALACEGRSNGGLLVGNMLTTYPELFGAVICGVPLLDMKRYSHLSAGASWTAEYGDPDVPEEWEFIRTFSPYHLLREGIEYPATFLYAATSDDRVGPVQARKMAARMQSMGIPEVLYYENADGGHGGAVDNSHTARLYALMYGFAWEKLSP